EPSSETWPTLAAVPKGSSVPSFRPILISAVQSGCTEILRIEPTVTSSIITGEFAVSVPALGTCTVISYALEPVPCAPGSGREFSPFHVQPDSNAPDSARPVTAVAVRLLRRTAGGACGVE